MLTYWFIYVLMDMYYYDRKHTMNKIKHFESKAIRAYKDNSQSHHDTLLAMENAIERISLLHKRIASDADKEIAISRIWLLYQTRQQRMVVEQSIYMDGMKKEQNAQVCMLNIGETPAENLEREMLFKPRTLLDASSVDVTHVEQLSNSHLLFNMDGYVAYQSIPDKTEGHIQRYNKPNHHYNVVSAFWKGIPYHAG